MGGFDRGRKESSDRKRVTAAIIVLLASLATLVVATTGAVFSDTASVGANTFSAGSVDIATSPTSAIVSFATMAPGDKVTAAVTVTNSGSLQLRYAVKSTTTEATLAAQLDMTVKVGVTTCTNAAFGTDGTVLYPAGDLGSTTGLNIIGDSTQGAQGGDRTLAASASEVLCIQVSLPLATGNSYQNLTSTATLDFISEQTVNN